MEEPMKKLRGILIDSVTESITEVTHNGDYREIYKFLSDPENGYNVDTFTVVYIDERNVIFVDDNGLLTNPRHFFAWRGYPQPLAGRGLILGSDAEGETIGTRISLEKVKKNVAFTNKLRVAGHRTTESTMDHPLLGPNTPVIKNEPVFVPAEEDEDETSKH
jgi:hypothetical protein